MYTLNNIVDFLKIGVFIVAEKSSPTDIYPSMETGNGQEGRNP